MKVMAESFSDAGVPVFMCDVKGAVAGICAPGQSTEDMEKRIDRFGLRETFSYREYPTTFWDIYQEGGHPIRVTVSEMGPELLSRILGLTDVQEGILHIVFRIADDKGLLLTDLKDLRVMLNYVSEHRSEYMMTYGNITPQSVAPSCGRCCLWSSRAATCSSESRPWIFRIGSAPMPRAGA